MWWQAFPALQMILICLLMSHVALQGWTPLHVAAGHSSSQAHTIIGDLAHGGAYMEATDREGRTPLLFALEGHRKDAIDALLHAGASPDPAMCNTQCQLRCLVGSMLMCWHALHKSL